MSNWLLKNQNRRNKVQLLECEACLENFLVYVYVTMHWHEWTTASSSLDYNQRGGFEVSASHT